MVVYAYGSSDFKIENLAITSPPNNGCIVDETIWLMKRHFLRSDIFDEAHWNKLREELLLYKNPNDVQ